MKHLGPNKANMDAQQSITAVIPTVGRPSLHRAINSALQQSRPISRVVVINTASADISHLLPLDERIQVIEAPQAGPSAARNLGIVHAHTDWVALLDDDDVWDADFTKSQINFATDRELDVAICGARVGHGKSYRERPHKALNLFDSILEVFYETPKWRSSRYYVQPSCIVARREAARAVPFDERLRVREDIWWLHTMQQRGLRVAQQKHVLVTVEGAVRRASKRETAATFDEWLSRLDGVDVKLGRGFALGIGLRTAIVGADLRLAYHAAREGLRR